MATNSWMQALGTVISPWQCSRLMGIATDSLRLKIPAILYYWPTKWDLTVQLIEANPPNTCPLMSLTTITTGPWLVIWWMKALKLSPWICVENKSRHRCCCDAGKWWLMRTIDGMSNSESILLKSTSNLHGITMCDLRYSMLKYITSTMELN